MKALYFNGKLALREIEKPEAGPEEALVEVALAGICGTDLQILKGYSGFRGIPGHEFVGRVVECSDRRWLGKRVVGEINVACRACDWCRRGLGRHCPNRTVMGIVNRPGAFTEFVALPAVNLHEVPEGLPDEAAVFVEPLAAAAEILEQVEIPPGTRVAVLGDGRLGLLIAQVLQHAGAQVTVLGRHEDKLALARRWGLEVALDAGPSGAGPKPRSFRVVVEATGSPAGLQHALQLVEPRGTVVMKSTFHTPAQFDTAKLVVDEVTLLGSRCGNFATALQLLSNGAVDVLPLISKTFALAAGLEAFDYLNRNSCLKVLLAPAG
ncbi:MAG TPA: alcohol dehydrogenase catalytic domain-containing protein [Terriglobia bacterium]|nr:alcohol dehydrogenase catalytic domain-containing protein [Terriglobia bacterium]